MAFLAETKYGSESTWIEQWELARRDKIDEAFVARGHQICGYLRRYSLISEAYETVESAPDDGVWVWSPGCPQPCHYLFAKFDEAPHKLRVDGTSALRITRRCGRVAVRGLRSP